MAVISVSIPDELKKRLDAHRKSGADVNVSSLAQAAIKEALDSRAEVDIRPDAQFAADRLRTNLLRYNPDKDIKAGTDAGTEWARSSASMYQLVRMECIVLPKLTAASYHDTHGKHDPWPPYAIYFDLDGMTYHDSGIARAETFWKARLADPEASLSLLFAYGFIAGARDFWEVVKPIIAADGFDFTIYGFKLSRDKKSGRIISELNPSPIKS